MIPCWLSYLKAVAAPPRDLLRELAEIPSSIVSSGLHVDDRSCARSGTRHHFYSIVAIRP